MLDVGLGDLVDDGRERRALLNVLRGVDRGLLLVAGRGGEHVVRVGAERGAQRIVGVLELRGEPRPHRLMGDRQQRRAEAVRLQRRTQCVDVLRGRVLVDERRLFAGADMCRDRLRGRVDEIRRERADAFGVREVSVEGVMPIGVVCARQRLRIDGPRVDCAKFQDSHDQVLSHVRIHRLPDDH